MNLPSLIDAFTPLAGMLVIAPLLVWYAVHKKYRKDRAKGKLAFLDANRVELILFLMFVAIAAPDWGQFLFGG